MTWLVPTLQHKTLLGTPPCGATLQDLSSLGAPSLFRTSHTALRSNVASPIASRRYMARQFRA